MKLALLALSLPAGFVGGLVVRRETGGTRQQAIATTAGCVVLEIWGLLTSQPLQILPITFFLGWGLLVLAIIDGLVLRLPDILTLPLIAIGLLISIFLPERPLFAHVVGAAAGAALSGRVSAPGPSSRCIMMISIQRPNLKPTAGKTPIWAKPSRSCRRIEPVVSRPPITATICR